MTLWFQSDENGLPVLFGRYWYGTTAIQATFKSWEMAWRVFPNVQRI